MSTQDTPAARDIPSMKMWTCPTCGRRFGRRDQQHVCDTTTVEDHLRGQDTTAVALFHAFVRTVAEAGPFEYAPIRRQVGFRGRQRIFAGVRLTARGLEGYLDLPRKVESGRFRHVSPFSRRLYVHHFALRDAGELDEEFIGWVREAHAVGEGE